MTEQGLHRVVALVSSPQSTFELGCVAEVFGVSRPGIVNPYDFRVCTERPGPIRTIAGYDILVRDGLAALQDAHTVVIAGWPPARPAASPRLLRALRAAHRQGKRIVAICSGAFPLAEAGLLDHRRATTHWRMAEELTARYPDVIVDADVLYIDHGDVATSAGTSAGIDLCLHLVRTDFGAGYAAQVARHMVMPPHREGGQLQYAATPAAPNMLTESLAPLIDWASRNLHTPLSVNDLATYAGVSARTLTRRFVEQLGTSPGKWLLAQRIAATRQLLEQTDLTVETIAGRVGLSTATNLRRRFNQAVRTTPAAYRRTFRDRPTRHDHESERVDTFRHDAPSPHAVLHRGVVEPRIQDATAAVGSSGPPEELSGLVHEVGGGLRCPPHPNLDVVRAVSVNVLEAEPPVEGVRAVVDVQNV